MSEEVTSNNPPLTRWKYSNKEVPMDKMRPEELLKAVKHCDERMQDASNKRNRHLHRQNIEEKRLETFDSLRDNLLHYLEEHGITFEEEPTKQEIDKLIEQVQNEYKNEDS